LCKAFKDLIFHHLWNDGNVGAMVMVLQFAVIVRTDDRRTWELENYTDSIFVDRLIYKIGLDAEKPTGDRRVVMELCDAAHRGAAESTF
jgi:hypothetical protein